MLVGHADATVRVKMSWVFILSTPVKILLQGSRKPKLEFRCGEIFRMRHQYAEFKLVSRDQTHNPRGRSGLILTKTLLFCTVSK